MSTSKPRMPAGLGNAGRALWRRLVDKYEFDPPEITILEAACRQADDVARLEAVLKDDGAVVTGSMGQARLSQVVSEIRLGRIALARLIAELRLPTGDEAGRPAKSAHAQRAADARWARHRRLEAVHDGSA